MTSSNRKAAPNAPKRKNRMKIDGLIVDTSPSTAISMVARCVIAVNSTITVMRRDLKTQRIGVASYKPFEKGCESHSYVTDEHKLTIVQRAGVNTIVMTVETPVFSYEIEIIDTPQISDKIGTLTNFVSEVLNSVDAFLIRKERERAPSNGKSIGEDPTVWIAALHSLSPDSDSDDISLQTPYSPSWTFTFQDKIDETILNRFDDHCPKFLYVRTTFPTQNSTIKISIRGINADDVDELSPLDRMNAIAYAASKGAITDPNA